MTMHILAPRKMFNVSPSALAYIQTLDADAVNNTEYNTEHPYLDYQDNALILCDAQQNFSFQIDFDSAEIQHRIHPLTSTCDVVKAIEGKSKDKLKVADLTAGLGIDSFTLASCGHTLYAVEQNPMVYWLLYDGLQRAKQDPQSPAHRITLWHGNNINFIDKLNQLDIDVIYLDPMFPERKKSAKVKKNMQLLHQVVGHQISQDDALLAQMLKIKPCKKIVVKRPAKGDFLNHSKPTSQRIGKSSRFDIYAL